MSFTRVLPLFSAAFALIYVLAEQANIALVTYHPRINDWDAWTQPARSGPAMYWFGWIGTAFLGATLASVASLPFSSRMKGVAWIGWVVPLLVILAFFYLMRGFFLR
ncbi:MAG: hypothetical protein K2X62_05895 [Beijerinckiaceae bacterium]|nr:hypothetical protein [Beijerinckiaceae bacterium]MDO9442885.1 hypothetical protein [Beijerinckiaceae bacterium]